MTDMAIVMSAEELTFLLGEAGQGGPNYSRIRPKSGGLTAEQSTALLARLKAQLDNPQDPQSHAEAIRQGVYWYRRAEFAETALEEFVSHEDSWRMGLETASRYTRDDAGTGYWSHELKALESALLGAKTVLAERRKEADDFRNQNFEDYIRDRRQKKILAWNVRTFSDIEPETASPIERAFRFLEESVELWQAVIYFTLSVETTWPTETEKKHLARFDKLVLRVLENEPGKAAQELGGVAVTALALAEVLGLSFSTCEKTEFERVLSVPKKVFEARHTAKMDIGI